MIIKLINIKYRIYLWPLFYDFMLKNITEVNFDNRLYFDAAKQNFVVLFRDISLYLAELFLLDVPFIYLAEKGKNKIDMSEAIH